MNNRYRNILKRIPASALASLLAAQAIQVPVAAQSFDEPAGEQAFTEQAKQNPDSPDPAALNGQESVSQMVPAAHEESAPVSSPAQADGKFRVNGTEYATLQLAFNAIPENGTGTIEVTGNVTVTEPARCTGSRKMITMKSAASQKCTITRGDDFAQRQDSNRSTYNPAMIEIDGTLTLENIILDDAAKTAGTNYVQAGTGGLDQGSGAPNHESVQDALVAMYDGGDTIILGEGCELRNFGGMSAVRASGGVILMKSGSKISGSKKFDNRGVDGSFGAAGAVWLQGGTFTMEAGAVIENVHGRAIYADGQGSMASISGTIRNTVKNSFMWNGEDNIHARAGAEIEMKNGAMLEGNGTNDQHEVEVRDPLGVEVIGPAKFILAEGAVIKKLNNRAVHTTGETALVNIDGEITGIKGGKIKGTNLYQKPDSVFNLQGGICTIGTTGNIHHNIVGRTTIYLQSNTLHLYGKVNNNFSNDKSGGVEVNNNTYGVFTMYPGAQIRDNYGKEHGAGVMVCRGLFTMEGGTISGNIGGMEGAGVNVRRGGRFIMNDGTISQNVSAAAGGGIAYDASETNYPKMAIELLGGQVSGNIMKATVTPDETAGTASWSGGTANEMALYNGSGNIENNVLISPAMNIDRRTLLAPSNVLLSVTDGTQFALAGTTALNRLNTEAKNAGMDNAKASFYAHNDSGLEGAVSNIALEEDKPVWIIAKKVDENGNPAEGPAMLYPAEQKDGKVQFALPAEMANGNGCVAGIVQPGTVKGNLNVTTNIAELIEGQDSYPIEYTLHFNPQEFGENVESVTVEIISPLLQGNKTMSLSKNADGSWSGTWTGTLPKENFKAGQSIFTAAKATIQAAEQPDQVVYGNGVSIAMKAKSSGGNKPGGGSGSGSSSHPGQVIAMHRLYNPNSGEHFYTQNIEERDYLDKIGWNYEGIGWYAPKSSSEPVYRVYNPNAGDHHYTLDAYEKDVLVSLGWKYEGIGWYSANKRTGQPLHRQYNPNAVAGSHNFTVDENERDYLVSLGWHDESIAWHGVKVK